MKLLDKIQRDIDEIAEFGYCNYAETFSTLIEAKDRIKELEGVQMAPCMLSILDSLKLYDNNGLELGNETLSEMMFRKMEGYGIDLNKELGFTHLEPVIKINEDEGKVQT